MCDRCYRGGIPRLPLELVELKRRGVITDWELDATRGWRVKTDRWGPFLSERDMQQWLDTELVPR